METKRKWGFWRDSIFALLDSSDGRIVVRHDHAEPPRARSGLGKAARALDCVVALEVISGRETRLTLLRPVPNAEREPDISNRARLQYPKGMLACYEIAKQKGLPCTITPDEARDWLAVRPAKNPTAKERSSSKK